MYKLRLCLFRGNLCAVQICNLVLEINDNLEKVTEFVAMYDEGSQ